MYYFADDDEDEIESVEDRLWHIRSGLSTTINLSLLDLEVFPEAVFDYPQVTVLRLVTPSPLSADSAQKMADLVIRQTLVDQQYDSPVCDLANNLAELRNAPKPSTSCPSG